jgi:hypothetical protein
MQVQAIPPRVTASLWRCLDRLTRMSETTPACARVAPERHESLHRGRRQPREHRCRVRPRVHTTAVGVPLNEAASIEQASDPRLHRRQDLRHVQRITV